MKRLVISVLWASSIVTVGICSYHFGAAERERDESARRDMGLTMLAPAAPQCLPMNRRECFTACAQRARMEKVKAP